MIKAENGKTHINGSVIDIISDYTGLTRHMVKAFKEQGLPDDFIDFLLDEARELSKLNDEELSQKKRELEIQMIMKLFK